MTAAKRETPKGDCSLCNGRGWFRTQDKGTGGEREGWPAFCHRCFSREYIEKMRAPISAPRATAKRGA